jgi:hypothetical protein
MLISDSITPKNIFLFTLSIISFLLMANIYGIYLLFQDPDSQQTQRVIELFDFNQSSSVPSLFIISMLFLSTCLLIYIGRKAGEKGIYWYGLAFIFGLLTASKAFHIQKIIFWKIYNFKSTLKVSLFVIGILLFLSIILFFIIFIPFFSKLPKPTLKLIVFSLFIFVIGAVVFDKFGTLYTKVNGNDLGYYVLYTIEESLEMIGISLFVFGWLKYLNKSN